MTVGGDDGVARRFGDCPKARFAEAHQLLGLALVDLMASKAKRNAAEQRQQSGSRDRKVELENAGLRVGKGMRRWNQHEPAGP